MLFIIGDWNAKVENQEIPEITGKFGLGIQNEAGQRLTELCQENALVIATPSSNNTRDDSTHRFHKTVNTKIRLYFLQLKMEKLYTVSKKKKKRLGADCGSDHELLIAKFRLKLKKVRKATRPLRCDLNQIPYDYTVKMTNKFKGLDVIDRVTEELWMELHDNVQQAVIKTILPKRNAKRQNGCLRTSYNS